MKEKLKIRFGAISLTDGVFVVLGLILYSVGLTGFLLPNKIVTGGLAGISMLINYSSGIPIWISVLVINSVLLIFAWFILGRKFVLNTVFGAFGLTLVIGIAEKYITHPLLPNADPLMASIVGAICCGTGLGLVYSRNVTTGGTDIVSSIIIKYKYISMGRGLMYIDLIVILSSWVLFQSVEKIVYGLIVMAVMYYAVDMVISGARQSVQFFIFSSKYDEIASLINSELHRGCTVMEGQGWYSKKSQKILIVLARKTESPAIFRLVKRIDDNAFITQSNVVGVYGKGFDKMK